MLSNEITDLLKPFGSLNNKAALSTTYRSLLLTHDCVAGCSSYAALEIQIDLGLDEGTEVYVDTAAFLAVLSSFQAEEEVHLNIGDGVLQWECGSAKGRLALAHVEGFSRADQGQVESEAWTATSAFDEALTLGALSCAGDSMASSGMFGICIDMRSFNMFIYASDSVTVSCCDITNAMSKTVSKNEMVVLSPDAAMLLSAVMLLDEGSIHFEKDKIVYYDAQVICVIRTLGNLKHDLAKILDKYKNDKIVAALPAERIAACIKRVNALSEDKRKAAIKLSASGGRLLLSFSEGTSSFDEYYLVEGNVPDLAGVSLDATKFARALAHVDEVVLDYATDGALVMRGKKPKFTYLISARKG